MTLWDLNSAKRYLKEKIYQIIMKIIFLKHMMYINMKEKKNLMSGF